MGHRCRILASSLALALALALATGAAMAGGLTADMFTYGGFGTAGVARSSTDLAEFVTGNQTAGATTHFDYKTDSKLGLQGSFAPTQWLSATMQVLAMDRYSAQMTTQLEWAYMKVQPTADVSMRYGKLRLPTFLASDSRDVGYANTWLRPPNAVYGEAIYDTFEGGDFTYKRPIGKYSLTVTALVGEPNPVSQQSGPDATDIFTGHHMYGYGVTADLDTITLHASVLELTFHRYITDGPSERGIYDFYDLGAAYDRNNILAQGEFIELRTGDPDDNINGWYLMGGYRLGKWLPYAIYAANHKNQGGNGAIPERNASTFSVGVRLDLFESVDFKAQIDHAKALDYGSPFINIQPGFNNEANIFSLVVDFIF
jgi:hypothetical protein